MANLDIQVNPRCINSAPFHPSSRRAASEQTTLFGSMKHVAIDSQFISTGEKRSFNDEPELMHKRRRPNVSRDQIIEDIPTKHEAESTSPKSFTEQKTTLVNHGAVASSFASLFDNTEHSDVVVHVEDKSFNLHRLLLLRSPVLRCLLLGRTWEESKRPEVRLEEPEYCVDYMEEFFRYMYTGEVALDLNNVLPLLTIANKYDVKDLEDMCVKYACHRVFTGTKIDFILEWWLHAEFLNQPALFRKCMAYIILNMEKVLENGRFVEIPFDALVCLLKQRDMVISNEYRLYSAIMAWLNHHALTGKSYEKNLNTLMSCINFYMMTPIQLNRCKKDVTNKTIENLIQDALDWHLTTFRERKASKKFSHIPRPRLYTGPNKPKTPADDIDNGSCATVFLRPEHSDALLETGVHYNAQIPVSQSARDLADPQQWRISFREERKQLRMEISTMLNSQQAFDFIDTSVLIYKHIRGETFVKGVMQLRIPTKSLPAYPNAQHIFPMVLPAAVVEEKSAFQIPQEDGTTCAMFKLIYRHY